MSLYKEIKFEDDICEQLSAHGWLYAEKDAADYDRQLALFPADVLAWVQEAQPDAWKVLTKNHGDAAAQTLLNRLRDSLNQSGTLHVLRQGLEKWRDLREVGGRETLTPASSEGREQKRQHEQAAAGHQQPPQDRAESEAETEPLLGGAGLGRCGRGRTISWGRFAPDRDRPVCRAQPR